MAVSKNIVSFTLLAHYLRPEIEKELRKKVKPSAVIMALRRYAEKLEKKEQQFTSHYFRNIILKTDICFIVVDCSLTTLNKLQEMYTIVDFKQGDIFNIIQGNYETTVITNKKYEEKLIELIGQEKITKLIDNHISISLMFSKDTLFTPGVFYTISQNVAWEDINILTWINTPSEMSLILHRDDAMKCYAILEKMLKKNEDNNIIVQNMTN